MTEILASEWTKMRSVRSTMWTLAVAGLMMLLLGGLISFTIARNADSAGPGFDPTGISLVGTPFSALAMATLGVLVVSSEYRTGMIRTSLLAVPQRISLLAGKVLVFTVVSLVFTAVAAFATFFLGQALISSGDLPAASLGDEGVLRVVFGTALFLTVSGLFGLALGALVRHTPGALVAVIALILVLPQLTSILPGDWGQTVHQYFTANAGGQVTQLQFRPGELGPWAGLGVYVGWVAVTMIVAAVLLRRRDA